MKIYNKFVESKKEPSNKNDIWFDGSVVRLYEAGEWYTVTLSKEALEKLVKYAENVKIFKYVDTLPEIGDPSLIYFQKELSDGGIILVPYVYDGEWKQITNSEVFTETSPFGFGDAENSAVLKGGNNKVTNANEVALGEYNESNNDTRFSIGVGTSDTDRRNAIEVKENGDVYITGIGGYNDDNFNKAKTLKSVIDNKIDKIEGKDLSSNDFTNTLKEKLESLENYDDAEISSAVEKLSRDFNALLGDNASAAIESFNEIIAFLEGIEDSASLDAIVASIQQEIAKVSNGLADTDAKLTNLSERIEENEVLIEELEKNKIVVDSSLDANSDNPISNQLFTNSFNYLGAAIKDVRDDVEALGTEVSNKEDKPIEIVMNGEPADTDGTDTGVTYYLNKTNIGLSENDSYTEYYQKVLAGNVLLSTGSDYHSPVNKYVHEDYVNFNIASQFAESGIANGSITIHSSPQTSPNGAEYYVEVRIWFTANSGGGVSKEYVDIKVTELSAEVSGLSEKIENLPSGEQEVFWATEGITDASKGTTYDDILAAHNAGKVVKCLYQKIIFDLRYVTNILYFAANVNNNLYYLKCPQSNKWQYSTENTEHKLEALANGNAQITIAGKTAEVVTPKEWKCVYDGRFDIGLNKLEFSTLADGTPLKANEVMVQVLMDAVGVLTQGYVVVHSTTNTTDCMYGAIHFGRGDTSESAPAMCQMNLKASPFYMVAEQYDLIKPLIAQGVTKQGRLGNKVPPQIYEDITFIRLIANNPISTAAPLVKIYAR